MNDLIISHNVPRFARITVGGVLFFFQRCRARNNQTHTKRFLAVTGCLWASRIQHSCNGNLDKENNLAMTTKDKLSFVDRYGLDSPFISSFSLSLYVDYQQFLVVFWLFVSDFPFASYLVSAMSVLVCCLVVGSCTVFASFLLSVC